MCIRDRSYISIEPKSTSVRVGSRVYYNVTAYYSDQSTKDVLLNSNFVSTNPSVAEAYLGVVLAKSTGVSSIIVSYRENNLISSDSALIEVFLSEKNCGVGQTLCDSDGDGIGDYCSDSCVNATNCNNNLICDENESCTCVDCDGSQDGCGEGLICSYYPDKACVSNSRCTNGTTKCADGFCRRSCEGGERCSISDPIWCGYPQCSIDGNCSASESCNCIDCDNKSDSCGNGSVCDYLSMQCVPIGICMRGTTLCSDGVCRPLCGNCLLYTSPSPRDS